MTAATNLDFGAATEAITVAVTFASSIKDRTILITGVNKLGIGYTTAQAFASQAPECLILTGRSIAKVNECIESLSSEYPSINICSLQLDLSSQKSVRAAAEEVLSWSDVPTIDLLINNAGVMNIPNRTLSEDGIEMHFATNHIGHFLFTSLIMPKIIAAAKGKPPGSTRIINLTSIGAGLSALRVSDIEWVKPASQLPEKEKPNFVWMKAGMLDVNEDMSYIPMAAYGHSKAANILFSMGLNKHVYEKYGILSLALHPGEIATELTRTTDPVWLEKAHKSLATRGLQWKTPQQGASTTLVAALDPKLGKPEKDGAGVYLSDCQIGTAPPHAVDSSDAEKLWEISEGLVKEKFSW